jgi:LmbE family N-acetylglucosaminyl deacetylase
MKKILIIAAHPDDEVLGCGGLIAKNIRKKNKIRVIFLAEGITARYSKKEINSPKVLKKSNKRNDNAILALKELGLKKSEIFLSTKPSCRLDDFNQLDIIKIIEKHIKDFKPNEIFTHWHSDTNIDHRIVYEATMTASRPVYNFNIDLIASYEVLSSTEWNFRESFNPNYFEDISEFMDNKIKAIKLYKDELKFYPHSRSIKSIKSLSNYRGVQSGYRNAEAFNIIKISK